MPDIDLGMKFFAAYRAVHPREVTDDAVADMARRAAADFRERLPLKLRQAFLDRKHWRPTTDNPTEAQIDEKVRESFERLAKELTVADIAEEIVAAEEDE